MNRKAISICALLGLVSWGVSHAILSYIVSRYVDTSDAPWPLDMSRLVPYVVAGLAIGRRSSTIADTFFGSLVASVVVVAAGAIASYLLRHDVADPIVLAVIHLGILVLVFIPAIAASGFRIAVRKTRQGV